MEHQAFYEGLFLAMGCSGQDFRTEQEKIEEAWRDLQAVPSYVEQQAAAWAAELALPIEQV
jgi:hypothetical protein